MVVPNRHVEKYTDLNRDELLHAFRIIQGLQLLLDDLYSPKGYNIGMNQGRLAGGSIEHLHVHVVPRFGEELGYIDIVGKTRIVVESLDSVQKKIKNVVDNYLNKEFFENFK
jgi:ATP adenylyltransferase